MNECKDIISDLEKYIDDELTETEKKTIDEHLAHCTACSEELAFAKAVRAALKDIEMPQAPPDFLERVNAAVDNTPKRKTFGIFGTRAVSTVAACLVIAAVLSVNSKDNLTEHMDFHKISVPQIGTETVITGVDKPKADETKETIEERTVTEKKIEKNDTEKKVNKVKENVRQKETEETPDPIIASTEPAIAEETADLTENEQSEPAAYSLETAKDAAEDIPETASASVGGGGGSSARLMGGQKEVQSLYADKECIDEIKTKAEKYGCFENGVYTMDAENYTLFENEVKSIVSQCELPQLSGESIFFIIEERGM